MHQIVDRNECQTNPCEQTCTNTEGSFECSCFDGYALQDNGQNCEGMYGCIMACHSVSIISACTMVVSHGPT